MLTEQEKTALLEKINQETAKIPWADLQRFFASGSVFYIAQKLDIIEVAMALCDDDKIKVEQWIEDKVLHPVTDDQARAWFKTDASLWASVIKPWVLVQELKA